MLELLLMIVSEKINYISNVSLNSCQYTMIRLTITFNEVNVTFESISHLDFVP